MPDAQRMVHSQEDDLELYAHGRLEAQLIPAVESRLVGCVVCRQHLAECLERRVTRYQIQRAESEPTQKRAEERFSTEGEATLQELHPLSVERQKVKIVNISKNGLGVVSPKAILPGTVVQIRIKETVELGNVRYCSALDDDSFRIGLRLHGEG